MAHAVRRLRTVGQQCGLLRCGVVGPHCGSNSSIPSAAKPSECSAAQPSATVHCGAASLAVRAQQRAKQCSQNGCTLKPSAVGRTVTTTRKTAGRMARHGSAWPGMLDCATHSGDAATVPFCSGIFRKGRGCVHVARSASDVVRSTGARSRPIDLLCACATSADAVACDRCFAARCTRSGETDAARLGRIASSSTGRLLSAAEPLYGSRRPVSQWLTCT